MSCDINLNYCTKNTKILFSLYFQELTNLLILIIIKVSFENSTAIAFCLKL